MMSDPFVGNVEIVWPDGENRGVIGTHWTVDAVPAVLETIAGVTGLVAGDPEPAETGRVPEAQWSGQDASGFAVTVRLWRQREEDLFPPLVDQSPGEEGGR